MDLIVILVLAFLLFIFVAMMNKPQKVFIDRFMEKGQDVQPLFKQKSAQIKFTNLHEELKADKTLIAKLEELKKVYDNGLINIDAYNLMLDEIYQEHIKH